MRKLQVIALGAVCLAGIVAAVAAIAWPRSQPTTAEARPEAEPRTYYRVEVDGLFIGYIDDEKLAEQALDNALSQVPAEALPYTNLKERFQLKPQTMLATPYIMQPQVITEELLALVPQMKRAWAITVDGQDVVAVDTRSEAEAVVQGLKDDYTNKILKNVASIEQLGFLETITFREKWTVPDQIRTREQAKDVLRFGTDKRIFYKVQRGDTLWDIANRQGLKLEDLVQANPDINPDRLQIGQEISMTVKEPYVHLESSEIRIFTQPISFPEEWQEDPNLWPWQTKVIQPGKYGQKRVTVKILRKDGREVNRETLEVEVLSQPAKQVAVRGTKLAPDLGSGQLHWPVEGRLTSGFGPRWGDWHGGIDLAAPSGTPVYAADNGTVVFAGRLGNYGNTLMVDHGSGQIVTLYGHLSRFGVSLGQQVTKGQVIAYVGNTGRSTGPHLHFEVRVDGKAVNPLKYYP